VLGSFDSGVFQGGKMLLQGHPFHLLPLLFNVFTSFYSSTI
jgi:hypothetical protein